MFRFFCCLHQKPSSELQNIPADHTVRTIEDESRDGPTVTPFAPIFLGTLGSVKSEGAMEIRRIFDSSIGTSMLNGEICANSFVTSDEEASPRKSKRSSTSRLQEVLLKRLSRDSGLSSKSSRRRSAINMSEESVERRKELKRALHKRLQEELLEDKDASHGGYDSDAEVIGTPSLSSRNQGTGKVVMGPELPSDPMRWFESLHSEGCDHDPDSQQIPDENPLHKDDNHIQQHRQPGEAFLNMASSWETGVPFDGPSSESEMQESNKPSKSSFPENQAISSDPAETAMTVPRDRKQAAELDTVLGAPDLSPLRPPSVVDNGHDGRLSFTASQDVKLSQCITLSEASYNIFKQLSEAPKSPLLWPHGDSEILLPPNYTLSAKKHRVRDDTGRRLQDCNDSEAKRQDLGGVNGQAKDAILRYDRAGDLRVTESMRAISQALSEIVLSPCSSRHLQKHSYANSASMPHLPFRGSHLRSSSNTSKCSMPPQHERRSPAIVTSTCAMAQTPVDWPNRPLRPGLRYSSHSSFAKFGTNLLGVGRMRRASKHIHSSSFQSSTDSFRAREIAAATKRIVSDRWTGNTPRVSRFKEELDDRMKGVSDRLEVCIPDTRVHQKHSFDGNYELDSKGNRSGLNYDLISEDTANTSFVWERALREHAYEVAHRNNHARKSFGHGLTRGLPRSKAARNKASRNPVIPRDHLQAECGEPVSSKVSPKVSPKTSRILDKGRIPKINIEAARNVSALDIPMYPAMDEEETPSPKTRWWRETPRSWAKWPSHTRYERSGPAGASDQVTSYDFGSEANDAPPLRNRHPLTDSRPRKVKSMTFGKRALVSMSRLRKSSSSDLRSSVRRGFRSSISVANEVKYPELELLGRMQPTYFRHGDPAADDPKVRKDDVPVPTAAASEESSAVHSSDGASSESAKPWSRLYRDLVRYPTSTGADTSEGPAVSRSRWLRRLDR